MVPLHPFLRHLSFCWKISAALIHGKGLWCGAFDRQTVFMDIITILFCSINKISRWRHPSGNQRNASVYGSYIYWLNPSCTFGLFIIRFDEECAGYMVCMAYWLDSCHGNFCFLLSQKNAATVHNVNSGSAYLAMLIYPTPLQYGRPYLRWWTLYCLYPPSG